MNQVILIGRLGQDAEAIQGSREGSKFSIATTERWRDKDGHKQERTEWHNVVFWGKAAEVINKYAKKGTMLSIVGELQYRKWEDTHQQKRVSANIVGKDFEFLSSSSEKPAEPSQASKPAPAENKSGDDDLPF